MKAIVEQDLCIGCGACIDICPAVFQWDDDKAVASPDYVPPEEQNACRDAAEACPVEAIILEE